MNNGITVSKETTNLLSSDKSTMIYWGFNTGGSNFIATYNTNGGYNDLPSMDIEVINQSDTVLLVYYTTTLNTPQICSIYIKALNELAFNKNVYTYLWRNGTEISDSEGNTSYEYKRKWHYVTSAYSTNNFQAVRLTNLPAGAKIRISAPQVQLGTYPTPWVLGGTTRTHGKLMYSPSIWNGVGNEFTLRIKCKFNFGYDATNPDNVFGLFRTSISPGTYGSNDNFESYIVGDTTKTLVIRKRVSAVGSTVKSTVLSSSTWDNDHIITITAKNGTAYLYYDGVLLGSGDVSDVNWDLVFDGLILGSYSKDYTNYNSSITFKEVSIFKDAKSADWVKDNSSLYQCEDQNKNVILSYFDLATKVRPVTSEIKPIDKVLELADGTIYGPDLIASIDHIERGVVVSKATTNLAPSQIVNSYNNCSSTVNRSSTVLSEQLFGQNITRTTWSAINETGAVSIRTDIGKGCYFTGMTFVGQYAVSVYYRSNRTVNFNHQPTNQQIWDTSVHTDSYGNTWNRIKRRTLSTANATDFVYFGFTLPDYVLGEEFWIDFACFQIETGSYHTPFVLPNWNLLNYNQSCGNGTVSAGITEVNYTSGGYDNFEYSRLTLNTASDYQYTSFSVNPTIGEVISHGCWVKGSASAIGKRATFMYNTSTAAYFTFTITGEWQYVKYENYTVPKLNSYLRVYLYSWEANFAVNDHLDICQVQTVYGATVKQWRYGGPSRSAGKLLYPSSMFPTVNGGFALKVKPFFNYDTDSYKIFFQIGNADTSYNFFIGYRYETDKFYCVYKHNLVSTPILFLSDVFTDNESLQQDTYFHVFYDNTYLYVYVNGILKVTYDISSKPFSDMLAQRGYQIFGRYYDDTLQADSTFKEFMIFDRVLNSDEINYLIDN
jgi:hypothetical protein